MLPKGKGKIAGIILAKLKAKDEGKGDDSSEEKDYDDKPSSTDVDPGMESAMEDLIAAVKSGDAAKAARALCDALHCHEGCSAEEA